MKKITAQVILKDKREQEDWAEFLRWEFVEVPPTKDHYGNGIYISATRMRDKYNTLLDCRYIKGYSFEKAVDDFLLDYYGEKNVEKIVEEYNY